MIKLNDTVKIKIKNINHDIYTPRMELLQGMIGKVVEIDEEEYVVVNLGAHDWVFLPSDLIKLRNRGFEIIKDEHRKHSDIEIQLPTRGDSRSAGYDFYSNETVVLQPKQSHLFWTDVKSYMLDDEVLSIHVRSSIGTKKDLMLKNTTGIIDSSYYENVSNDGNIGICLVNMGDKIQKIEKGERIAQGIFTKYLIVDEDTCLKSKRTGGFGSSGK